MNRLAGRFRPAVHDFAAAYTSGNRETTSHAFTHTDQIGHHVPVFAGEPFAGSAKTGINLIEDQQKTVPVAKFPQARKKIVGRNDDSRAALDRFDQQSADIVSRQARRNTTKGQMDRKMSQLLFEVMPELSTPSRIQCAVAKAMIGTFESENARFASINRRSFKGCFHRLEAGIGKNHFRASTCSPPA